jgi:hypothetical protein
VQIFKIAIELAKHFSKVISDHSRKVKIITFTIHHHPSESHHLVQSQKRKVVFTSFKAMITSRVPKTSFLELHWDLLVLERQHGSVLANKSFYSWVIFFQFNYWDVIIHMLLRHYLELFIGRFFFVLIGAFNVLIDKMKYLIRELRSESQNLESLLEIPL